MFDGLGMNGLLGSLLYSIFAGFLYFICDEICSFLHS